jgi:hypothetical protein
LKPEKQKEKKRMQGHVQTHQQSQGNFLQQNQLQRENAPNLEKLQIEIEEG